ncbi:glycoside hydrolase family 140 protein [Niabella terrae]
MNLIKNTGLSLVIAMFLLACNDVKDQALPPLQVASNPHYFEAGGKPFFWLGDTGWLLLLKCSREETLEYLDIRQQQGFNVIQVMLLHTLEARNVYGDAALQDGDITRPIQTPGNSFQDSLQYDYWDHVAFVVQEAARRGIYLALVPVWGSAAKDGKVTAEAGKQYGSFLAQQLGGYSNIIWLNGGDIPGDEKTDFWLALGSSIKKQDPNHLMTYHPRGRYSSTDWFHDQEWLDFNMFQSGHRTYAQDTSAKEKHHFGEDNWRYVAHDYQLQPTKPVLDGEPSYENIPHGLHDSLQPRWTDADLRRYAYWSVFAGAAGFTYGENAVMQFNTMGDADANFGVYSNWKQAIHAPGATQMHFLKNLIMERDYYSRQPAQDLILDNTGEKYEYLLATKGKDYALVYTYTGRNFQLDLSRLGFQPGKFNWFRPADGHQQAFSRSTDDQAEFDPPGSPAEGNDWVLIISK